MKTLASLLILIGTTTTWADGNQLVHCHKTDNENHFVELTLNVDGKIIQASKNQFVTADKKSEFSILAENLEEAAFESIKSFRAPNGYSIVTFITTADAISVGVSKDRKSGFYSYQDIGSGNGNSKLILSCEAK